MNTKLVSNRFRGLGLAALVASVALSAGAQTYTAFDLGMLPGGTTTTANGINNVAQVVGIASVPGGNYHAFLYGGGTITDFYTFGGASSAAIGINDSGQVVGYADIANGTPYAFLYSGGALINLGHAPWRERG